MLLLAGGCDGGADPADGAVLPDSSVVTDSGEPFEDTSPPIGDGGDEDSGADSGPPLHDGEHPTLHTFRVEPTEPSRVYFDSSESIRGEDLTGFVVGGVELASIVVRAGQTSAHYFAVEAPITYWDNLLIRYDGGSDLADAEGHAVHPFTLRYVDNRLPEPEAAEAVYYVDAERGSSGDGGSPRRAFRTIGEAASIAVPGTTIWVKAGDYGAEQVAFDRAGTTGRPIRLLGYQATPGDAPRLERMAGMAFDPAQLPLLSGPGPGSGVGIRTAGPYTIVRNIQVESYEVLITGPGLDLVFTEIDNVYLRDCDHGVMVNDNDSRNVRVKHSYVANCSHDGVRLQNRHNLIDDVWAVSTRVMSMDYYLGVNGGVDGGYNIVRNSYVQRFEDDTHSGHGISMAARRPDYPLEYNLIEDSRIHQVGQAVELRHHRTRYSVVRGVVATGTRAGGGNLVTFRDGTSYNVVESCRAEGTHSGVLFNMNADEDLGVQEGGTHNVVRNSIFRDVRYMVRVNGIDGTPLESTDNRFEHCTFHGAEYMYSLVVDFGATNTFEACTFSAIDDEVVGSGAPSPTLSNSNFWRAWATPSGDGNISVDPEFADAAGGDFTPGNAALDYGEVLPGAEYDFDGRERTAPTTVGAIESAP